MPSRRPNRMPAKTPEGRENQLVSSAYDLAEKQLHDGTASSQVVMHFLKAGSTREKLEKERLYSENELLRAKVQSMESAAKVEEMYSEALAAMQSYRPEEDPYDRDA